MIRFALVRTTANKFCENEVVEKLIVIFEIGFFKRSFRLYCFKINFVPLAKR